MTEIRYCELVTSPDSVCTGTGNIAGPAGEGWQVVALMPLTNLPAGSGQYAVILNGRMAQTNYVGVGAVNGRMEVALGIYGSATRFDHLTHTVSVQQSFDSGGAPFQLVLVVSTSVSDPVLGTSWNPNTQRLCLWGRTWRNGDAPTYTKSFQLHDISWLWWDLANIPAGDRHVYRYDAASFYGDPFGLSGSPVTKLSTKFPTNGSWLIFSNYRYRPTHWSGQPRITGGYTWGGGSGTRIGADHRWGRNYVTPISSFTNIAYQHHGWWVFDGFTNDHQAVSTFVDDAGTAFGSKLHTWTVVGIRLDDLLDVRSTTDYGPRSVGLPVNTNWWERFQALERPGGIVVTSPIVLAHSHVKPLTFASYGMRVTETGNPSVSFGDGASFQRVGQAWYETVSTMAWGKRDFQIASPTMQWRASVIGSAGVPTSGVNGYLNQVLQFHPIKDPENVWIPTPTIPATTYVTPGRQAILANLLAPPTPPNANPLQRRQGPVRAEIEGLYRRSWLIGSAPERIWSLTWGPLPMADALAVRDFLVANAAWLYRAPKATTNIPVFNLNRPQLTKVDHRVGLVSVDVAQLYYTG